MADRKKLTNGVRVPSRMSGERGGARYRIKSVSSVGGGHQGGLLTPRGVGQVNI